MMGDGCPTNCFRCEPIRDGDPQENLRRQAGRKFVRDCFALVEESSRTLELAHKANTAFDLSHVMAQTKNFVRNQGISEMKIDFLWAQYHINCWLGTRELDQERYNAAVASLLGDNIKLAKELVIGALDD